MTREEKQKALAVLKISAPIMAVTQEAFTDYTQTLNKIMDWLEQEPITTMAGKPKTGHWIKIKPYPLQMHDYECSECLHETDDPTENYCSECGAKMIEPQESEVV